MKTEPCDLINSPCSEFGTFKFKLFKESHKLKSIFTKILINIFFLGFRQEIA